MKVAGWHSWLDGKAKCRSLLCALFAVLLWPTGNYKAELSRRETPTGDQAWARSVIQRRLQQRTLLLIYPDRRVSQSEVDIAKADGLSMHRPRSHFGALFSTLHS